MVKLLVGHKGSGKTKQMIELANESVETSKGSIIFINKNHRLMYDLKYRIRVICMEDFEHVTNSDEYIGFLYGIISSDHDIETIFIDSILKHADFTLALPEFYDEVLNQTGYVRALEEKKDMESRGRIENVQELKSNILGFLEQDPEDATLSGFLNEIALYTDLDSVEADDNCVTMMTIHSAKGLEFPVVYVVGMEEGIFPGASAQYDQEELEEERRLCYVAMTRAKEKLTLTNCRQRMLYGRTSANRASRFLEEIPEENMRWESKPEPRFGGMEHDGTFGGDRYEDGWGSSPARAGGSWSSGGVHSYRAPAQAPQRPLASVQQASSARKNAAPAAPLLQLQQGDMVEHTAFGKGMVLSVRPMGGDALAEVAFDTVGKKKLMLKSAGAHMRKL